MRYLLQCLFHGPVVEYQKGLIAAVADRFDLRCTQRQGLAPHFTVKYWFETYRIEQVEVLLERFAAAHRPTAVTVGGIGSFPPDVVFLTVELSAEARATFNALVRELRTFEWMQWDQYDGDRLHFHATVAEQCGSQHDRIIQFLTERRQQFECSFDNITILHQTGMRDGIQDWSVHRTYLLQAAF